MIKFYVPEQLVVSSSGSDKTSPSIALGQGCFNYDQQLGNLTKEKKPVAAGPASGSCERPHSSSWLRGLHPQLCDKAQEQTATLQGWQIPQKSVSKGYHARKRGGWGSAGCGCTHLPTKLQLDSGKVCPVWDTAKLPAHVLEAASLELKCTTEVSVGTRRVGRTTPEYTSFQSFWQVREVTLSPLWCLFWIKCSQDVFAHHKPGMLELCTCYWSLIGKWMGYWQMEKQTNELYFGSLHFSMLITAVCWFLLAAPRSRVVVSAGVHCWVAPVFCLEWIHFRSALSDISL